MTHRPGCMSLVEIEIRIICRLFNREMMSYIPTFRERNLSENVSACNLVYDQ